MSPRCDSCGEHIDKLNQQVSVMRREIKNLRQMLDSAVRAHRKQMMSIQSAVSNIGLSESVKDQIPPPPSPELSLHKGIIQTVPIGYISSCFSVKNGTPRQPTICGPSRATLSIQQSVFNNPEHALLGLEHYSHVWIIFLFHKNGHLGYKAKVKPPRLDGQRVGVYSTRSPHRPNALGLTLAKLDKIEGDTIHLSDIDMIAGTPVLDIKPYIPEYDSPSTRRGTELCDSKTEQPPETTVSLDEKTDDSDLQKDSDLSDIETQGPGDIVMKNLSSRGNPEADVPVTKSSQTLKHLHNVLKDVKAYVAQSDLQVEEHVSNFHKIESVELGLDPPRYGEETYSTIAGWIREPPVSSLEVRFTPHAERELARFLPTHPTSLSESHGPRFKFLHSPEEAAAAIRGILSADPRSVYRRTRCKDRLFFFTLDTADITCWFGPGFVEVLQVRPVEQHSV